MIKSLIVASSNQERLALWKGKLSNFVNSTQINEQLITNILDPLKEAVLRVKPITLILDIDLFVLNGSADVNSLREFCAETKTVILSDEISEDLEWELLKAGIRGCCRYDIDSKLFNQVLMTVEKGEMWIRRSLTSRFIDELSQTTSKNKAYRATLGLLNKLTQREYDIAMRVSNGECNKQIARECAITERTVKSHLTEIFHKLGVADRLNLALIMVADNRVTIEHSSNMIQDKNFTSDSDTKIFSNECL
jgi:DNA-binding NarL/FixJ family response regulator